jgi:hypothetical protein
VAKDRRIKLLRLTSSSFRGLVGVAVLAALILFFGGSEAGARTSVSARTSSSLSPAPPNDAGAAAQDPSALILVPAGESALDLIESASGEVPEGPGVYFFDAQFSGWWGNPATYILFYN